MLIDYYQFLKRLYSQLLNDFIFLRECKLDFSIYFTDLDVILTDISKKGYNTIYVSS